MSRDLGAENHIKQGEELSLEREKFALEKAKFEADQRKREIEVQILQAELRKKASEGLKLELEASELRAPWYKRPAGLSVAAAGLLAFSSVIAAIATNYIRSERAQLEGERNLANGEKQRAMAELSRLREQSTEFSVQLERLRNQNKQATIENDNLASTREQLLAANTALKNDSWREAMVGQLRNMTELLAKEPSELLTVDNRYVAAITLEINRDVRLQQMRVQFARNMADRTNTPAAVRSLLYLALYNATSDAQWLRMLERLAASDGLLAPVTFVAIIGGPLFDRKDRADFVCRQHESALQHDRIADVVTACQMHRTLESMHAVEEVVCIEPYLESLMRVRDHAVNTRNLTHVQKVSKQLTKALTVLVTSIDPSPESGSSKSRSTEDTNDASNRGTPLRSSEYLTFKFADFWAEPDFKRLRRARPAVLKRVVMDEWVDPADVP